MSHSDTNGFGIDFETETLLSPAEAAAHPVLRNSNGKPCRVSKIYRLFDPGIRGVCLEAVRTPSGLRTSREAIARFIERLNAAGPRPMACTTAARRREDARVNRALDEAGIR